MYIHRASRGSPAPQEVLQQVNESSPPRPDGLGGELVQGIIEETLNELLGRRQK